MNTVKRLRPMQWLLMLTLCAVFIGCKDDAPAGPSEVDITDPNAVAKALTIGGAISKAGIPPAPSTDANAPQSISEGHIVQYNTFRGKTLFLYVLSTKTIAGVYLRVKGADTYFQIPAIALVSKERGGSAEDLRTITGQEKAKAGFAKREKLSSAGNLLQIDIPGTLTAGNFCIELWFYDAEHRVSRLQEVCVNVIAPGGKNSAFLTNNFWTGDHTVIKWSASEEEVIRYDGTQYEDVWYSSFYCNDDRHFQSPVIELSMEDLKRWTFTANGSHNFERAYYYKDFDSQASKAACSVVYKVDSGVEKVRGLWSYNDETKKMTLLYEVIEEGAVVDSWMAQYDVIVLAGKLELKAYFGYGGYVKGVFKPGK